MSDLILRQNLSETSVPLNLVLRGVVDYGETEAVAVDVYWRWEDEETMEPQFLAKGVVGQTIAVPFDPKGRDIRLFQVSKTSRSSKSVRSVKEGVQIAVDMEASRLVIGDLAVMTSAEFAAKISDETGTGKLVFATSPVLIAPILGTPNSGLLTNCTGFPAANLSGMASWMPSFLTTPNVTDVRGRTFSANGLTNPGNTYFYAYSFESSASIVSAANFSINNLNAANAGTYGVFGEARQAVDRSGGNGVIFGGKFTAVVAGNCETAYGLWGRLSVDVGKTATEAGAVLFGTTINGSITTFSGLKQELVNAGTVTNFYGTFTRIQNNSGGTITAANALRVSVLNNGNTIPNFKGIAFEGYSGSGAITNNYLIYADTSTASYGSTLKYGIYFLPDMPSHHVGKFGLGSGVTAPTARLQVRDTAAPQVRVERDSGNYLDIAVSSAGVVTFDAVGGSSAFLFGDAVTFTESITLADAKHIITNTANGSIIATSTSQKLGFWERRPSCNQQRVLPQPREQQERQPRYLQTIRLTATQWLRQSKHYETQDY
ncbi:MAG: hypothetical protein IPL32_19890 [Chloracidobacterium sp.]|nr:hypothetical protein [Chloracidobacterium sp.]